jgi:hypothetical protein
MAWRDLWRRERGFERKAAVYLQHLMAEPRADDVAWLAGVTAGGDRDHAGWELRYAKRALGLIAAQRDALDDRTASAVAAALSAATATDPRIDPAKLDVADRQFNVRVSAYRDGLEARGGAGASAAGRLGQTLLAFSGAALGPADGHVDRGGRLLLGYLTAANEALRGAFGSVFLPDGVPPSVAAAAWPRKRGKM